MGTPRYPVNMEWILGVSSNVRGGVVDLRTDENNKIAYTAGHTVVLYDPSQHRQIFLQGHVHAINCLSACPNKKFIVSADCGPRAILIIWNIETGQVHSSFPQNDTGGIVAIDFASVVDQFATLSMMVIETAGLGRPQPELLENIELETCLRLNQDDQDEFITNGKESVFCWRIFKDKNVDSGQCLIRREEAIVKTVEVPQNLSEFLLSIFVPGSDTAITAMVSGEVIVWKEQRVSATNEFAKVVSSLGLKRDPKKEAARQMHALKIIRLHQSAITHLSVHGNYIVTGGADGHVRFYDPCLGLSGWFEELLAGEIMSISFSRIEDYSKESNIITLQVPPFIVSTKTGHIILLSAATFEELPGTLQCKGKKLMDYVPKMIRSVSAHPNLSRIVLINADGYVQVHDYNEKRIRMQREFCKLKAEVVAYSPSGSIIACGFLNGLLKIVDSERLHDLESIAVSRTTITVLKFSADETYLAVADASYAVSLLSCSISKAHVNDKWEYVGKFRSHAKTISGLHFANDRDGGNRLFSIGHDSMIVEYDLINSMKERSLKLRGSRSLNSPGLPTAIASTNAFKKGKLHILISDSEYKIRVYDGDTLTCHKTFLGPTFETPIKEMHLLSLKYSSKEAYIAFVTEGQILGLMVLNLEKIKNIQYFGVIGHASPIRSMALSYDRKFLFTLGGNDSNLCMWEVNYPLLDKYFANEEDPVKMHFLGCFGSMSVQLIKEYFFASQFSSQDDKLTNERNFDTSLRIDQMHKLLFALGIFLSTSQIEEILKEYSMPHEKITFNDFLSVFINHKPVTELDTSLIQHAFNALGSDPRTGQLNLEQLLATLETEGEKMARDEIKQCLSTIMHKDVKLEELPTEVTATWFCNAVLNI